MNSDEPNEAAYALALLAVETFKMQLMGARFSLREAGIRSAAVCYILRHPTVHGLSQRALASRLGVSKSALASQIRAIQRALPGWRKKTQAQRRESPLLENTPRPKG